MAIVFGLILSGMLPEAPAVIASASPTPSQSVGPSPSQAPASASSEPTARPTPELIGTLSFGAGLNQSTQEVIDKTDTFASGSTFCHSISLPQPFGVDEYQEEVLKIRSNGKLTIVQKRGRDAAGGIGRLGGRVVQPDRRPDLRRLRQHGWGTGDFMLRAYRRHDGSPQLLAQGRFTLTE